MDIPTELQPERTRVYTKKRTLKDGTVKVYTYNLTYRPKTDVVQNTGKSDMVNRIRACRDREKIERIKMLCDELGI